MSLIDEASSPGSPHEPVRSPREVAAAGEDARGAVAGAGLPIVDLASPRYDLDAMRRRLEVAGGEEYWRSFDQLADTPEFRDFVEREFPRHAAVWDESVDRRKFLGLMGASLALAGAGGCLHQPEEKIVPYVRQPDGVKLGEALYFATAMPFNGYAEPLLVTSRMGRPIKVEGNPEHPASLGSTSVFAQASMLGMYDPDRSKTVIRRGNVDTWGNFVEELEGRLAGMREWKGAGLAILTETVTSPTLGAQLEDLLKTFPKAKWHSYQPVHRNNARAGALAAFGENLTPVYKFDQADVVLALDCDFLYELPGSVRYARDFVDKRRVVDEIKSMNRLYVVESTPTLAGAASDHRWRVASSKIESVLRSLAAKLGVDVAKTPDAAELIPAKDLGVLADDLTSHKGSCLVVVGDAQPPAAHALAHAINRALGNVGKTVEYVEPVEATAGGGPGTLAELASALRDGKVETLLILGGNPVYNAPAEVDFEGALKKALGVGGAEKAGAAASLVLCARLGEYYDETSLLAHWHLPQAHYLESWGDARAYDGTAGVIQPLIAPLYGGKTAYQVLAVLQGRSGLSAYEIVQSYWQPRLSGDFANAWRKVIHDGLVPDSKSAVKQPGWTFVDKPTAKTTDGAGGKESADDTVELVITPDPCVWDGRFANNAWLQELAKPLTKLVWDNAALVGPATFEKFHLSNGDVVSLKTPSGRKVEAPVWLIPGQADGVVTLALGYGRAKAGKVGTGIGYDAYEALPVDVPYVENVTLAKTGKKYYLVATHDHWSMEGRDVVKSETFDSLGKPHGHAAEKKAEEHLAEAKAKEDGEKHEGGAEPNKGPSHEEKEALVERMRGFKESGEPVISMFPDWDYSPKTIENRWAMQIDQTACIGCNACVIACQAENNIPIVGKEQCGKGREMHWLRIDRYYKGAGGGIDNPESYFQPVPCMHCEDAPCELVCPVAATTHDAEGLNNMVYNRCVGTRYCSNNCPYKVRRFNFFNYTKITEPTLKMLQNPEVTVRSRGVMEKCSYCVQRIDAARITAKKELRSIRDGEVRTACQAACPTQAITFGNLNDTKSHVVRLRESPLDYALLAELGVRPRTRYLARVRNPHPELRIDAVDSPQPGVVPTYEPTKT